MYFIPFAVVFPEIGAEETRCLYVLQKDQVEVGCYGFCELYCIDPACDCQIVRFIVMTPDGRTEAIITYGWNDKAFYDEAFSSDDHNFPGPDFAFLEPQGPHAKYFLNFCKEVLITDDSYVERLKRHYALFKKEAKKRDLSQFIKPNPNLKSIGRNDPCFCGSGKKYKKCCGRP
jgi:hypothetical protein